MRRSAPSERNEVLGIQGLRANRNLFQIIVEGCKPIPETKLNLDGISFAELFTSLRDVLELYLVMLVSMLSFASSFPHSLVIIIGSHSLYYLVHILLVSSLWSSATFLITEYWRVVFSRG
mmetsp:Transcript_80919/g.217014  ORF Transcript_80919/g.217014 Transcript_80919/m.217014 type:complete len:120 (-) Transcript_80919:1510-1869(-)